MTDITSGSGITRISPQGENVEVIVETAATADTADTIVLTLNDYGILDGGLLLVDGFIHTTANSVIVAEAPTTAVSSGVLTITIGGSTVSDKKRTFRIVGKSV